MEFPNVFISIIIPSKNSSKTLSACLESIYSNLPKGFFEVILADNGSIDDTIAIAKKYELKIITAPNIYVSEVRNVGAAHAKGPILAFIDSDCLITPEWYPAVLYILRDPKIGITGCRHDLPDYTSWCEKIWHKAHNQNEHIDIREVTYIPAGNLITHLSIFKKYGGFDESLETGEDPDLCYRMAKSGYKIIEYKKIRCIHLGNPKNLWQIFKRESWHGKGARFTYPNGCISPVVISTSLFYLLLLLGVVGIILGIATSSTYYFCFVLSPLVIPIVYSLYYGKGQGCFLFLQLCLIYLFYFLGRSFHFHRAVYRLIVSR